MSTPTHQTAPTDGEGWCKWSPAGMVSDAGRNGTPSACRAIRAVLFADGEHGFLVDSLAATISMTFAGRDVFVGTLTAHGHVTAPERSGRATYYVRLSTPLGEWMILCNRLRSAMQRAQVAEGDVIVLAFAGRLPTAPTAAHGVGNTLAARQPRPSRAHWLALRLDAVVDAAKQQLISSCALRLDPLEEGHTGETHPLPRVRFDRPPRVVFTTAC
jgi:hypothetical protein